MTTTTKTGGSTAYQFLKYAVYLALLANVFLFLIEEIDSAGALNTSVTGFASFFQIFSTTIDTAAWLALLIFFELETYVLSDNTLRGRAGQLIHLVRLLCLATISVACWGYFAEFVGLLGTYPITTANCTDIDSSWSVLINLDKFEPLATNPCEGGQWLALTNYERVVTSPESYQRAVFVGGGRLYQRGCVDLGGDCLGDRSACSAGIFSTAVYRAFSNQPGKRSTLLHLICGGRLLGFRG